MESLTFVHHDDAMLDAKSCELSQDEIHHPATQGLFDRMLCFARGEQGDRNRSVLVGLAAPQVGKNIRVILVDIKADGKGNVADLRLYINPEIIELSQDTESWYEGCYSTGVVKGIVQRPRTVTIRALNRHGHEVIETHVGYVARIFQHEIDHLDGIRFPERIPEQGHIHLVKDEEMARYRNEQAWKDWQKTVPVHQWKQFMREMP